MMGVLFVGTTNALGVVWRTKTEGAKKAQRGRISEVLSKLSLLIRVKSLYLHLMNGESIKRLRNTLGLTQKQLAEKLGVSLVTINKWEHDKASPRNKYISKLESMNRNEKLEVVRPIQYLGSKLRLLGEIGVLIDKNTKGLKVCDLFSGSGVVSHFLSSKYKVISVDIQEYSRVLTSSLVNSSHISSQKIDSIILGLSKKLVNEDLCSSIRELIEFEKGCIFDATKGDPNRLVELSRFSSLYSQDLSEKYTSDDSKLLKLKQNFLDSTETMELKITRLYGGVYFSYEQAIHIDIIRSTIQSGPWNEEVKEVLLAALISSASEIANTVGKQFAQPMKLLDRSGSPKKLLVERTIRDRSYSVLKVFFKCLERINSVKKSKVYEKHEVLCMDSIDFLSGYSGEIDCFYIDPPYTIDHYSRFYHVLETIAKYDYPTLATMKKKGEEVVMNGLYRTDRHQSPFCIPSKVDDAFEHLFSHCSMFKAPVILSYSPFDNENDERPRLMTTQGLLDIAKLYYRKVTVVKAKEHVHRKLHSTNRNSKEIESGEVFIVCSEAKE